MTTAPDWKLAPVIVRFSVLPCSAADGETDATLGRDGWPGGDLGDRMVRWSNQGHYLFPIQVNAAMRMMTPIMSEYFQGGPACNPHG